MTTWAGIRVCRALAGVLALAGLDPHAAAAAEAPHSRLWLEFGLGIGQLSTGSNDFSSGGTGLWVDLEAGARLNRPWSLALDVGALGMRPSRSNYGAGHYFSSVWGEAITNVFLVAQYEPQADRGWFYTAGGGPVLYHNQAIEDAIGDDSGRVGNGYGFTGRIGYDWPRGDRWHVEAVLGIESGRIRMDAPLSGSFRITAVTASVNVALR